MAPEAIWQVNEELTTEPIQIKIYRLGPNKYKLQYPNEDCYTIGTLLEIMHEIDMAFMVGAMEEVDKC